MYYTFLIAAALSAGLTGLLYAILRKLKARQVEREEGPDSHKKKTGTPTMGGIAFVISILTVSSFYVDYKYIPVLLLMAGFALIGLADDLLKVWRRQNLGLTFWQKIVLQTLLAFIFSSYIIGLYHESIWILAFWMFIIVGSANATNLTDGLDGLLAGCAILAFIAFGFVCFKGAMMGAMALCFIIAGALLGFLIFNFPRAFIFMGDVGSLSIGAALAGIAIIAQREWALALIGAIFVAEALSVIIQVLSYKLWKRRIFKMAPLHHHFELSGLSELKVVLLFWLAQLILSIIGGRFM